MNVKKEAITNTRKVLQHIRKHTSPYEVDVCGYSFLVCPNVFSPQYFFSTSWFADKIRKLVEGEPCFLEVGCGAGIIGIVSALANKDSTVFLSDISELACENTCRNIIRYLHLDRGVGVWHSDVYDSITKNVEFNTIFWAMPFGYLPPEEELGELEKNVFDPGYKSIIKFIEEGKDHLAKGGRLLAGFSKELGHYDIFVDIARSSSFSVNLLDETFDLEGKTKVDMGIYELKPKN